MDTGGDGRPNQDDSEYVPLSLVCQGYPSDRQTKRAKRFGEGFTWICPNCRKILVMTQGKGKHWYWNEVPDVLPKFKLPSMNLDI